MIYEHHNLNRLAGFDKIFLKHYHELVCFVNSYLNNKDESVDIVQNTFVKFWEVGDFSRDTNEIRSFLYTTARNYTFDLLKHKKIQQKFIEQQKNEYQLIEKELVEDALRSFNLNELDRGNLKQRIRILIMKLPYSDRKIFVMSKCNNLTNNEIAELLRISPKTVEKRLKIILSILRKHLIILGSVLL